MSTHSTPLADARDAALDLASLAEMLSQELGSRVSHDENSDGPNIAALAQLLSERLAAHRDRLEALATRQAWLPPPVTSPGTGTQGASRW